MHRFDHQTQPASATPPALRLLERPRRPAAHRAPPARSAASVWSRLERWAGNILR